MHIHVIIFGVFPSIVGKLALLRQVDMLSELAKLMFVTVAENRIQAHR